MVRRGMENTHLLYLLSDPKEDKNKQKRKKYTRSKSNMNVILDNKMEAAEFENMSKMLDN